MPPRAALTRISDGLTVAQLLGADDADGLGGLGQVHRDDVAGAQQLVEPDEADAHLRGAAGGDERVVGDDVHAERRQPLGDQRADAAEADDAGGLLVELDAGVPAALPLPLLERRVGRRDVAGGGEQQADGELGGADDVGLRRVDDHDAGLGRRLDVDVVQADAGAGDDLEAAGGGEAPRRRRWSRCGPGWRRRRRPRPAGPAGRCRRTLRTSKSGPSASTVAGESSSAMRTTGLRHRAVLRSS